MIILPVVAFLVALASGHLAGACGPGGSGSCELDAGIIGIYAAIPGFIIAAAAASVVSDRRP